MWGENNPATRVESDYYQLTGINVTLNITDSTAMSNPW